MTKNKIEVFKHELFGNLTTLERQKEVWFIAKEVSDILGYEQTEKMMRRLDEDEKDTHVLKVGKSSQQAIIISESGLYNAVFGSKKKEAKKFRRWVTSEILPSIHRTGKYVVEKKPFEIDKEASEGEQIAMSLFNMINESAKNAIKLEEKVINGEVVLVAKNK